MKKIICTICLIFAVANYGQEQNSVENNNEQQLSGKIALNGVIGTTMFIDGLEYYVDGTYMFTDNWGVSLGYYGGTYDSLGKSFNDLAEKFDAIYIQAYYHSRLFGRLNWYVGFGLEYVSLTTRKWLWQKRETQNYFMLHLQGGFKYWINNKIAVKLNLARVVGLGVCYVL